DLDLDFALRNDGAPVQRVDGAMGDLLIVCGDGSRQPYLDFLGIALDALDAADEPLDRQLLREARDVTGEGGNAVLDGNSDIGGIDAGLPLELIQDALPQRKIVHLHLHRTTIALQG